MKITDIRIGKINIPLKKSFKSIVSTVSEVSEIVIKIITDTDEIGIGSAAPTPHVTGDTEESIIAAIKLITPNLMGQDIDNLEDIMSIIDNGITDNCSAKAAIDMAVYDLFGKKYNLPLYKYFGGNKPNITTGITISVGSIEDMVKDSLEAIRNGFQYLKIKVGTDPITDLKRVKSIRQAVRKDTKLIVDANQGWTPKEAVKIINKFEDLNLNIELIEQPVKAWDLDGLKFVTDRVMIPILADESVHNINDALNIIEKRAANCINVKLMKCGGFHNAIKILNLAEMAGIECMMGCMVESKIGVTAASSFALAKKNITKTDLDMLLSYEEDPIEGGVTFDGNLICASNSPGLGIKDIKGWQEI
ncbi:dipeptide epimerase [Clostridium sediminicola]|uniref:dipeptide epimerase n=1 Tax=Clostridium sediminicola TaxID=3114879 RepID=UPI0031F21262